MRRRHKLFILKVFLVVIVKAFVFNFIVALPITASKTAMRTLCILIVVRALAVRVCAKEQHSEATRGCTGKKAQQVRET